MRETVLLTGSTGLLGSYILKELIKHNVGNIIVLSRGETQEEADRRVYQELGKHLSSKERQRFSKLVEIIRGDITQENLGLSKKMFNNLTKKITLIYHSAALCKFNIPLKIIRKVNVKGTDNILKFALVCKKYNLKEVHYISTIAVAGDSKGVFYEDNLDLGQKFNNTYEQSKFEAEKLVVKYKKKGLPITIYRPGILVGDSVTGYTNNFQMFYQALQIFFSELFNEIPADKNSIYYLVPVDYVAKAIMRISLNKNDNNNKLTYHIINSDTLVLNKFLDISSKYFKFKKPLIISKINFCFEKLSPFQMRIIWPYIPYLNYGLHFDSKNTKTILGKTDFKWPKINDVFLRRLFKFCVQCEFIIPRKKPSLRVLSKHF
ncbi:MAG: SDR family oxidoreductase [bacterium]